eukprot:3638192-Prymnesium_polylepis.1
MVGDAQREKLWALRVVELQLAGFEHRVGRLELDLNSMPNSLCRRSQSRPASSQASLDGSK